MAEQTPLETELMEILGNPDNLTVTPEPRGLAVSFGSMYEAPSMSLQQWTDLRDFFGASDVVEQQSIALSGCETCDFGSNYGFEVVVTGVTKHADLRVNIEG